MTGEAPLLALAHSASGHERALELFGAGAAARVLRGGSGLAGSRRAVGAVLRLRPRKLYLVDIGVSTLAAALAGRAVRAALVIDTGDLAYELARSVGRRSRFGLAAIWLGERLLLGLAEHVVVRGAAHLERLPGKRATVVPDLPPTGARPLPGEPVRARLGLGDRFVVGLVGSLNWAPRTRTAYGWDLIEALSLTDERVCALIVGDGDARGRLEQRALELGVRDRCAFVGRVSSAEVAQWVAAMDACLSTQTNDAVGAVRTTGKLPLYLACGKPVIASDVGEARRLLGPLGWTIPYEGVVDRAYPRRLAKTITCWADDTAAMAERREQALSIARTAFDRDRLRERVLALIEAVSRDPRGTGMA